MEDVNWGCISWNKRLYFMERILWPYFMEQEAAFPW